MTTEKVPFFPNIIHALADDDLIMLSQFNSATNKWKSVKCTVAELKNYLRS